MRTLICSQTQAQTVRTPLHQIHPRYIRSMLPCSSQVSTVERTGQDGTDTFTDILARTSSRYLHMQPNTSTYSKDAIASDTPQVHTKHVAMLITGVHSWENWTGRHRHIHRHTRTYKQQVLMRPLICSQTQAHTVRTPLHQIHPRYIRSMLPCSSQVSTV